MLSQLESVFHRERNALQSTEFSFSRFLTPYLCGYEGWAIFSDCDMLMLDDITGLDVIGPNGLGCCKAAHRRDRDQLVLIGSVVVEIVGHHRIPAIGDDADGADDFAL